MRMEVRLGISECVKWGEERKNLKDNIHLECSAPTAIYLMELHGLFPPCDLLALEAAIEAENWKDVYDIAKAGRPDIVKLTPVNIHSHSQGNN
ncbi:MAG: hypothetical protein P8J32_06305 [bacterium]|nr:hypothetical protein [bacterium]